jgi:hypothetical protein
MLTFTERAVEALALSHAAATRWDPDVQLRIVPNGTELTPKLASGPEEGDVPVAVGAITVFVPADLEGTVDASDHNDLVLVRP